MKCCQTLFTWTTDGGLQMALVCWQPRNSHRYVQAFWMWKYLNKVQFFCLLFSIFVIDPQSPKVHLYLDQNTFPDFEYFCLISFLI